MPLTLPDPSMWWHITAGLTGVAVAWTAIELGVRWLRIGARTEVGEPE